MDTKRSSFHTLGLFSVLLAGCSYFVSWDDLSLNYIGQPISKDENFESWKTPDEVRTLPGGKKEYKYHLKKLDPSCIHYWIVNPQGIIVNYRYEGRCRPIG